MPELVIASGLFIVLLAVSNTTYLSHYTNYYIGSTSSIGASFAPFYESFVEMLNSSEIAGLLLNALVWAGIGSFVYVFFVVIVSLLSGASDAATFSHHYIHPKEYKPTRYWTSVILEKLFIASSIVVTVAIGVLWANLIMPWVASVFVIGANAQTFSYLSAAIALIVFLASFHVLFLSFRFVLLSLHFHKAE